MKEKLEDVGKLKFEDENKLEEKLVDVALRLFSKGVVIQQTCDGSVVCNKLLDDGLTKPMVISASEFKFN